MAISENLPQSIRRRLPANKAAEQAAQAAATPKVPLTELRKRRDTLAEQFGELQYDLGGMVYEMAIRDHYRLDVVTRRAAELQRVDAELAEAERLLRLEDAAASGSCRFCGSLHARGASFCWQCGERLLDSGAPGVIEQTAPGTINGISQAPLGAPVTDLPPPEGTRP